MFLTRERAKANLWIAARLAAYALATFLAVALPAESRADVWDWLTDLVVDSDAKAASLSSDELPSDAIVTEMGERRVLQFGRDVLELYPSTAIAIEQSGPNTSVRLITGTIRVKVAKRRKGQTFEVRTLMLVATVKGTDFEVSATRGGSAVSVYEGRVAVKSAGRVGGVDVTPGKTATVTSAEDAPDLGPTPTGGAGAATNALAGSAEESASTGDGSDDDSGRGDNREIKTTGRAASSGNRTSGGASGGSASDGDNDGEGSESGDGDGEGGDGEGGEGGDDGGADD
jgi:hypothetical protein